MSKFNKIRINFVNRPIPKRGPFNSDEYNSSQEEAATDFATVATRWNEELFPLLDTLPQGTGYDLRWTEATQIPDALEEGLDGSTIMADNDAAETTLSDDLFWDSTLSRPRTIKEALFHIDLDLAEKYDELSLQLGGMANGLTTEQWARLGERIRDGSASNPSSLDATVNDLSDSVDSLNLDFGKVIDDVYTAGTIPGTRLTKTIQEMLSAVMALHDGAWGTDATVGHTNLNEWLGRTDDAETDPTYSSTDVVTQNDSIETAVGKLDAEAGDVRTFVGKGATTTHSYSSTNVLGSTDNHEAGLGKLDTEFNEIWGFIGKNAKGSENREFTENNYVLDTDSLEVAIDKLDQALADVGGTSNTEEGYIRSFIGKGPAPGSETPSYTSTNFVTQSASLEAAISELDLDINTAIGNTNTEVGYLRSFMGKTGAGSEMPDYSSNNFITDATSLETALGAMDAGVGTEFEDVRSFIGKGAAGSETPTYSSIHYISQSSSLETAIGALDDALDTVHNDLDGDVSAINTELGYIRTFMGKTAGNDVPTYSSTRIISLHDDVETAVGKIDAAAAKRLQFSFSDHADINEPIVWTHNQNTLYPFIQIVDRGVGDYSGMVADEVYKYEQEHGISSSDSFVSIEFVDANTIQVYTSVVNGVIVGVF